MPKQGKGSSFEREICKTLSLWWTNGKDEDVFWRTAGSGARAKTRSKKDLRTFGQYGDVQATNPIGQKLIDVCTIELKRGYSKTTFADIIDKKENAAEQLYEKFIHQAEIDCINANAPSWLLIVKRDRRRALVFMPYTFKKELTNIGCLINKRHPVFSFSMKTKKNVVYRIFGMTLDKFLQTVKPRHIEAIYNLKVVIHYGGQVEE